MRLGDVYVGPSTVPSAPVSSGASRGFGLRGFAVLSLMKSASQIPKRKASHKRKSKARRKK